MWAFHNVHFGIRKESVGCILIICQRCFVKKIPHDFYAPVQQVLESAAPLKRSAWPYRGGIMQIDCIICQDIIYIIIES